ncbi:unnamed protein product [Clonostachys rhizophaga]|uniref:F-box domain-containing protein n=1 Tax=Clonostachys rhizophaga TaxID=160324 RepID=A0A9N9VXE9_9HYPO|nr:unnamed protein product [Clonostachys rhizophaga]
MADCNCALCGAPTFHPTWDPVEEVDENGMRRYSMATLVSGPDDPELALPQLPAPDEVDHGGIPTPSNGQVNSTEVGGIGWVESNGGPHYTWTIDWHNSDMWRFPFHLECIKILCRYLDIPMSQLNNTSIFEVLKSLEEHSEHGTFLDIDYGDITDVMCEWTRNSSEDYFIFDPVNVTSLTELYQNPPRCDDSITHEKKMVSVKGDPFRRFSHEIILLIMSELDVPTTFKMRQTSPAFSNIGLGVSFWKSHIVGDMPWLWDFPASTLVQVEGVDWEKLYRTLYRGSRYNAANGFQFNGLCNRRRIWEQMCPVFAVPYLENESRRRLKVPETTQNQGHDE